MHQEDANGRITAFQSNMASFNRLQADITGDVLQRLAEVSDTELAIPIGTLTGSALLAGRGPKFKVRMQSIGSCTAHFENVFDHAGINQTKHQLMLQVTTGITVLLPWYNTDCELVSQVLIAETIIVGNVPDSYTQITLDGLTVSGQNE